MRLESLRAIWEFLFFIAYPMSHDRTKRLGKILENANRFEEAQLRRRRYSTILWILLVALILVGMFFAGRAWYSREADSDALRADSTPVQTASSLHADAATSSDSTMPR